MLVRQSLHARGKPERLEAGHVLGNDPEGERDRAALAKAVDAEARKAGARVSGVELTRLRKGLEPRRRLGADLRECRLEIGFVQCGPALQRSELAVVAQDRGPTDLQVDVACARLDGALEEDIQIHGSALSIGSDRQGL